MENIAQPSNIPELQKSNGGLSLAGIAQVIYQPTAFFEKLKDNPKVLVPWIVYFLLVLTTLYLIADLVVKLQLEVTAEMLERQGITNMQNMPTLESMRLQVIIGGTIFMMLTPLVAGALAIFIGNIVMAGKAGFKQILSVMLYGEILFSLGGLIITVPMILMKDSLRVSLSLAALLGPDVAIQSGLYLAASKIGVFYIWQWIAIGIGLSIVYGFSRNKGYVLSVLSMGMISVIHVLFTFIMGAIV